MIYYKKNNMCAQRVVSQKGLQWTTVLKVLSSLKRVWFLMQYITTIYIVFLKILKNYRVLAYIFYT